MRTIRYDTWVTAAGALVPFEHVKGHALPWEELINMFDLQYVRELGWIIKRLDIEGFIMW